MPPDDLHWLPIEQLVTFKVGVITYRDMHATAMEYQVKCSHRRPTIQAVIISFCSSRRSANAVHGNIVIPRTNTKTLSQRSFAVKGPVI